MKIHDECIPCVINQAIKVANITGVKNKEVLLKNIFKYMSRMNFLSTTPEIIGDIFEMIKKQTKNPDPYKETRTYYNNLFLEMIPKYEGIINHAKDPFFKAIQFAIVGNIIDFNPIHNLFLDDIYDTFEKMEQLNFAINDSKLLMSDCSNAKALLYLGDNCGEICMDLILIKKIKELNPSLHITYGVRGKPVVNDSIKEDAYHVGMQQYAAIIDNGDGSLGTVLHRVSPEFLEVYYNADIIISKGQANYECLSEEKKNIYFLLMTKCDVIANDIGVESGKMICMKNKPDDSMRLKIRNGYVKDVNLEVENAKQNLIKNLDCIHTTDLGAVRIRKNLSLETDDVVAWCRNMVVDNNSEIIKEGKNFYISNDQCRITVNSHSYTIITAHPIKISRHH